LNYWVTNNFTLVFATLDGNVDINGLHWLQDSLTDIGITQQGLIVRNVNTNNNRKDVNVGCYSSGSAGSFSGNW